MDFVRNDVNAVPVADGGQAAQGVGRPDHPSRVVWVRQDEQLALVVDDRLELLEIHLVTVVGGFAKRIVHQLAMVAQNHMAEGMVYRRLDDNLFVGGHQVIDHSGDAAHHARHKFHPFAADLPAVVTGNPLGDGVPIAFGQQGVAVKRMVQALLYGLSEKVGRLEFHVGHPQGREVASPEAVFECVVFEGARARAVDRFVE